MSVEPAGLRVGVDENGLGPRLGPMIVTGALMEVTADWEHFVIASRAVGIGDSKGLCAHGAMREVEATVLGILEVHLGLRPCTFAELFGMLSMDSDAVVRALCPDGEAPRMCFDANIALPAFGGATGPRHLHGARTLRDAGAVLKRVHFTSVCNRRLHAEQALGRSRFDVDLARMIDLVRVLRSAANGSLEAVCGKVGGRKRYSDALGALSPLVAIEEETAARSAYRVPGFGRIAFLRDADDTDPVVGLASLVGKYLRELSMLRIHLDLRSHIPELGAASGYHDPVTTRYIAATALVRVARQIPDDCFER